MNSYKYTDSATIKDGVAVIDEFFDCDAPILRRRGDLKLSLDSTNVEETPYLGMKGKAQTLIAELELETYVPLGSTVELSIPKSNYNYYA